MIVNSSAKTVICYRNGRLLRDHQIVPGDLWISDGKIIPPQSSADQSVDVAGLIIAPGFIDLQINGAFGFDFTHSPEKVSLVAKKLRQHGVTAFLPTLVSSKQKDYPRLIAALRDSHGEGAEILGIHLEGPHFSLEKRGAHRADYILSIDSSFYGDLEGVKLVTLAPELPGSLELIGYLADKKILVSAGHSLSSFDQMERGVQAGVSMITHLFNAMAPLDARNPALIGYVLANPGFPYTIIADGIHVDPELVKIAWKANPEGLMLVTDAMAATGLGPGSYQLGDSAVEVKEGRAVLKGTETLAGSLLTMDEAVRNLQAFTGCSSAEALEAASLKQARLLGIEHKKGTLEIGADADLIFLDDQLKLLIK